MFFFLLILLLQSSSRRRAKQSIALAERLVRSQNDCRKLQDTLTRTQTELESVQSETYAAEEALASVSGPELFVVNKMKGELFKISKNEKM